MTKHASLGSTELTGLWNKLPKARKCPGRSKVLGTLTINAWCLCHPQNLVIKILAPIDPKAISKHSVSNKIMYNFFFFNFSSNDFKYIFGDQARLTHWGWEKMATISQTTVSNAFSWMKMYELWIKIYWSLFLRSQLTTFQHWFR